MEDIAIPALEMIDLTVGYDGAAVLTGISAAVHGAARVAVVGPNGAGKSTLFKALAGLLPVSAGKLLVHGQPPDRQAMRIAYVPQREEIDWRFPATVMDVVLMGRYGHLGWFRHTGSKDRAIAAECLEQLGLGHLAHRPIGELSGGQQQRVFLARALAQQPDILVLDEPFAAVDAPTREAALKLLEGLHDRGITLLVSTHDLPLASSHFDLLMLLNRRLVAFGPPSEVITSSTLSETFGGQLLLYREGESLLAFADHCCPADERQSQSTRRDARK